MPAKKVAIIKPQPRDVEILRGLFECRVMTLEHAASLFFDDRRDAAKKRLQKLKAAGWIATRPRRQFEAAVYFLTRDGLIFLRDKGELARYPSLAMPALERRARVSDLTIRHELEVMEVKTAFHKAIKPLADFEIERFTTWPLLNEFRAIRPGGYSQEVPVRPDGYLAIYQTEGDDKFEHAFYLELDRSTEDLDKLVKGAASYNDHFRSGGFAVSKGDVPANYKKYPFRVLFVFKTAERRNNIAERLLQATPRILTQVCLATLADVRADPLGPVWIRPIEYLEGTRGTRFDPERLERQQAYRRDAERERFVESRVTKISLLDGHRTGSQTTLHEGHETLVL